MPSGSSRLAVLVYDRTQRVAPTAAFFIAAKFLPALIAPALTARLDQMALRRSLPALYVLEAAAFAALALIAEGDVRPCRSCWPSACSTARSRSPAAA